MRAKIRGVCEPLGFSLASLFFNSSRKEGRRIFLKASTGVSTGNWRSRYRYVMSDVLCGWFLLFLVFWVFAASV